MLLPSGCAGGRKVRESATAKRKGARAKRASSLAISWRRQDVVDAAGGDGAARHAVIFGRGRVLREGHAAARLNFRHPQHAVRTRPGEDHANRAVAQFLGKRAHEMVDRHVRCRGTSPRASRRLVVFNRHQLVWRDDVDVIGGDFVPSVTSVTGMEVSFASRSLMMLRCVGSRCWIKT